jgi:site-specific recombinase XerD
MAWIRQLPSGLYAATVRTPVGRVTESFKLLGGARSWARDQESKISRGEWIDPRGGKTTVGELWDKYGADRALAKASHARDKSHWKVHVATKWAKVPVGAIFKPDVSSWVTDMDRRGVGAATIQGALGVLRSMLEIAVDANLVSHNPTRKVNAPERDAHLDRVLTPDEDALLLGSLERLFGDRLDAVMFVELLLYCGLRWEEAAAIDRDHIDLRKRVVQVGPVVERDGTIRPYPKSRAGRRAVSIDLRDETFARLRQRCMAIRGSDLVITSARGKVLRYSGWHDRVWQPALFGTAGRRDQGEWVPERLTAYLDAAIAGRFAHWAELAERAGISRTLLYNWRAGRHRPRQAGLDKVAAALGRPPAELYALAGIGVPVPGAGLASPMPTPHDLRHTFGTRQGEQGVPPHELMVTMGHENLESVQRYLHAGDGRLGRQSAATQEGRKLQSS